VSVKKLNRLGVTTKENYNLDMTASLFGFENKNKSKDYKIGFNNFYVITRYNISQNYALAVYLLSEKIKQDYHANYSPDVKKNIRLSKLDKLDKRNKR